MDTAQLRSGAVTSATIEGGAISDADLAFGAVGKNQLQDNAVVTGKILDGTITQDDIDPSSSIHMSKTQVYIREVTEVIPSTYLWLSATCDDFNDVPLVGWCELESSNHVHLEATFGEEWDNPNDYAYWRCLFTRDAGSATTGTAVMVCPRTISWLTR